MNATNYNQLRQNAENAKKAKPAPANNSTLEAQLSRGAGVPVHLPAPAPSAPRTARQKPTTGVHGSLKMHAVVIDYSRYSATTYLDGVVMVLPYPPSANDYWRTTRTGRVFVSKDAARYREIVKTICTGITPMAGDLFVSYRVYRPQKSGDLQNRAKVLDDALNGIAWGDDKQITKIEMERFDDKEFPRIEVVVKARETK